MNLLDNFSPIRNLQKQIKIISVFFKPLQPFNVEEVKIKKGDIWSNSNGVCACLRGRW